MYIYYVYKYTHACIYLRKICYVYTLNIFIYDINYMNKIYTHVNIFKIYAVCVVFIIYI